MEKNRTIIEIDGKEYPVVSVESVEHIQEIAADVDRRVRDIRKGTIINPQVALVFTALNLADELSKMKPAEEDLPEDTVREENNRKYERRHITK